MCAKVFALAIAQAIVLRAGTDGNFMECPAQPELAIRVVPVRAVTPALLAVDGLQARNFSLKWNGSIPKICGFAHVRMPVSVGILLDVSGSMSLYGRAPAAAAIVDELLRHSGPQDEYFLTNAAKDATVRLGFTSDLRQIRAALDTAPIGRTALVDAMYLALSEFRRARHPTRALVVVSDGGDNQSVYSLQDLAAAVGEDPVPIFLIDPTGRAESRSELLPSLPDEAAQRERLFRFAAAIGGCGGAGAVTLEEMRAVAIHLSDVIRTPYILYFVESAAPLPRSKVSVEPVGIRPRPRLLYDATHPLHCPSYPSSQK